MTKDRGFQEVKDEVTVTHEDVDTLQAILLSLQYQVERIEKRLEYIEYHSHKPKEYR